MRIHYNETDLADQLRKRGIPVIQASPATSEYDACIEITGLVHVSIPSFGGAPCVVRETAGPVFVFGPEQRTLDGLVEQIKFHIAAAGHEVLQAAADAEDDYILDNGPSPC